ncbi:hypothetical protein ABZ883_04585 [Streptomyces sp. NPDC046977]|uniref:hypothetical protein n=1 Tax=Streptomyces sp. NPDC046977 TaxID=3154703 RepID=UPI0034023496
MNRARVADLGRALRVLGSYGEQLAPVTATSEQLQQIREDLQRALGLVADADTAAPTTTCRQHPNGPVEPGTDGGCLICLQRRGLAARADNTDVPAEVVAAAIEELGEQQAIAVYGGVAVARVLNARNPVRLTKGPVT